MSITIETELCGACINEGVMRPGIQRFEISMTSAWMGANDDDTEMAGTIYACWEHAPTYSTIMGGLLRVTHELLSAPIPEQEEEDYEDGGKEDEEPEADEEPAEESPATASGDPDSELIYDWAEDVRGYTVQRHKAPSPSLIREYKAYRRAKEKERAKTAGRGDSAQGKPTPAVIRAWGLENGYELKKGRLPGSVIAAYEKAHSS